MTDWITLIAALTTLVTALGGFTVIVKSRKTTDEIHKLVNSQHDVMLSYQGDLTKALSDAGVKLPERSDPSS
jgi:hypothetical protein